MNEYQELKETVKIFITGMKAYEPVMNETKIILDALMDTQVFKKMEELTND